MNTLNNDSILQDYKKPAEDLKKYTNPVFRLNLKKGIRNCKKINSANRISKDDSLYNVRYDENKIFSNTNDFDVNLCSTDTTVICNSKTHHSNFSSHRTQCKNNNCTTDKGMNKLAKDKQKINIFSLNEDNLYIKSSFLKNNGAVKYGINLNKSLDKISKIRVMQKFRRNIHIHSNEKMRHRNISLEHPSLFDKYTTGITNYSTTKNNNNVKLNKFHYNKLGSANKHDTALRVDKVNANSSKSNLYDDVPKNIYKNYINDILKGNENTNFNFLKSNKIKNRQNVIPNTTNYVDTKHKNKLDEKTKFLFNFSHVNNPENSKKISNIHSNSNSDYDKGNYDKIIKKKILNLTSNSPVFKKRNFLTKSKLIIEMNKEKNYLNISQHLSNYIQDERNKKNEYNITEITERNHMINQNKSTNSTDSILYFTNEYKEKKQCLQSSHKFSEFLKNNPKENIKQHINNFNLRHSFDISRNSNLRINNVYTKNNYFKKKVQNKNTKLKMYENFLDFEKELNRKRSVENSLKKINEKKVMVFSENNCKQEHNSHPLIEKKKNNVKHTLKNMFEKTDVVQDVLLNKCTSSNKKQEVNKGNTYVINIPMNFKLKKGNVKCHKKNTEYTSIEREQSYKNPLLTNHYNNIKNIENKKKHNHPNSNNKSEIFDKNEFLDSFLKKEINDDKNMQVENLFNSYIGKTMNEEPCEYNRQACVEKLDRKINTSYDKGCVKLQSCKNHTYNKKHDDVDSRSHLSTNMDVYNKSVCVSEQLNRQMEELKTQNDIGVNEDQVSQILTNCTQNFSSNEDNNEHNKNINVKIGCDVGTNTLQIYDSYKVHDKESIDQQILNQTIFEQHIKEEECFNSKNEICKSISKKEQFNLPLNWECFKDIFNSDTNNDTILKNFVQNDTPKLASLNGLSEIQNDSINENTINKSFHEENNNETQVNECDIHSSDNDKGKCTEIKCNATQNESNYGENKYSNTKNENINKDEKGRKVYEQCDEKIIKKEQEKKDEYLEREYFSNISENKSSTHECEKEKDKMDSDEIISDINAITLDKKNEHNSLSNNSNSELFNASMHDDGKNIGDDTNIKEQNRTNETELLNNEKKIENEELNIKSILSLFEIGNDNTKDIVNKEKEKESTPQNGCSTIRKDSESANSNNDSSNNHNNPEQKCYVLQGAIHMNNHEKREDEIFMYKQNNQMQSESKKEGQIDDTTNNVNILNGDTTNNTSTQNDDTTNNVNIQNNDTTNNVNIQNDDTTNNVNIQNNDTTNNVNIQNNDTTNNVNIQNNDSTNNTSTQNNDTTNNVNIQNNDTTKNTNTQNDDNTNYEYTNDPNRDEKVQVVHNVHDRKTLNKELSYEDKEYEKHNIYDKKGEMVSEKYDKNVLSIAQQEDDKNDKIHSIKNNKNNNSESISEDYDTFRDQDNGVFHHMEDSKNDHIEANIDTKDIINFNETLKNEDLKENNIQLGIIISENDSNKPFHNLKNSYNNNDILTHIMETSELTQNINKKNELEKEKEQFDKEAEYSFFQRFSTHKLQSNGFEKGVLPDNNHLKDVQKRGDNFNKKILRTELNQNKKYEIIKGFSSQCVEINKHNLFKHLNISEDRLHYINSIYDSFDYYNRTDEKKWKNVHENEINIGVNKSIEKNKAKGEENHSSKNDMCKTHFEENPKPAFNLDLNEKEGTKNACPDITIFEKKETIHQNKSNTLRTTNIIDDMIHEKIGNEIESNKHSESITLCEKSSYTFNHNTDQNSSDDIVKVVNEKNIQTENKYSQPSNENDERDNDCNNDYNLDYYDEEAEEENICYEDIKRNVWLQNANLHKNRIQHIQTESFKCILLFCYLHKIKYFQGMHDMIISLFYLNLQPHEILCVFEKILHYYAPYLYLQNSYNYRSTLTNVILEKETINSVISDITMQICNYNGKLFRLLFQFFFPHISHYFDITINDTWPSFFFVNLNFSKFNNVSCLLYIWMRLIEIKNEMNGVTCDFILFLLSFFMHKLEIAKKKFYEKTDEYCTMNRNYTCIPPSEEVQRGETYTAEQLVKYTHPLANQVQIITPNVEKNYHMNEEKMHATQNQGNKDVDNENVCVKKSCTETKKESQEQINGICGNEKEQTKRQNNEIKEIHEEEEEKKKKKKQTFRKKKLSMYCTEMFSLFFEFSSSFDEHFGDRYKTHIDEIMMNISKIKQFVPVSFLDFIVNYNSAYQKKDHLENPERCNENGCLSNDLAKQVHDNLCLRIKLSDLLFIHNTKKCYQFIFFRLVKHQIILSKLKFINSASLVIEDFSYFKNVDDFLNYKKKLKHFHCNNKKVLYIMIQYKDENDTQLNDRDMKQNINNVNGSKEKISGNDENINKKKCLNKVFFKRNNKEYNTGNENTCESQLYNIHVNNFITTLIKNNFKRLTILDEHSDIVHISNEKNIAEEELNGDNLPLKEKSFLFQMFDKVKNKIYENIGKDNEVNKNTSLKIDSIQNKNLKLALKEYNFKMFSDRKIKKKINCKNKKIFVYSKNIMRKRKNQKSRNKLVNEAQILSSGQLRKKTDTRVSFSIVDYDEHNVTSGSLNNLRSKNRTNLNYSIYEKWQLNHVINNPCMRNSFVLKKGTQQKHKKKILGISKKREINLVKSKIYNSILPLHNKINESNKSSTKVHTFKNNYNKKKKTIFINKQQIDEYINERERKTIHKGEKMNFLEFQERLLNDLLSETVSKKIDKVL
ncbi:hypothetical protein, conserved [Plasmodium gonderi]|uniref:Uncharacterized protein n=1 Tax=Plasmodium gonderi TaxID=77519 RepID=A0A1Y1JG77_PLAGO|nr:hypothetical protein, conserved [Plasmodium gonderi]GAW81250.1 hypothetical protein, conserved [Plasmodium gonderi]